MSVPINRGVTAYSALLTTIVAGWLIGDAVGTPARATFDEIDVERINVREEDGTLRMVISNTERFPGMIIRGKERPHPTRRQAGMLFYNEEGTENGGLGFGGKKENGTVSAGAQLAFDQYEQDQVIQITHQEHDGKRYAGLVISDRPDRSFDPDLIEKVMAMPDGAEKQAEMARLKELYGGAQRLFIGKTRERTSAVNLNDAEGRARIRLQVTAGGAASIEFLDEAGKVVRTLTPESLLGQSG